MSSLTPFKELVHRRCGLHLEGLAEARLVKAIDALKAETNVTNTPSLIAQLEQNDAMFDRFISQLTVNETYFYREPEALHWLADAHLPQRLAEKGKPLAIFSAGCSSGEEPYSVAIALFERYGERAKQLFQITGGDVDQQVLSKAQNGIYTGMSFRALNPTLKRRYFHPEGRRFKIDDTLRHWVTFRSFNLLHPDANNIGPFDVILFRNVSIYFDETTRRDIQRHLKQLLVPRGVLVCGVTETLGNDLGVLELQQAQGVFFFQENTLPSAPPADDEPLADGDQWPAPPALLGTHPQPSENEPENEPESKPIASFNTALQQAHQLLNQNAFSEATALLSNLLTQQPWNVDALLLAGLVARWQQNFAEAFDYFKRAIYIAPECWPAHFFQAELFRLGELSNAPEQPQRGYAAVIRLLDASKQANGGLSVITPPIPPGDAYFLATRYLSAQATTQGVG
ncbi:protein-glutamate O-methyltransferase CheR [Vreelandella andesensis]|uniref:Protein-glutamate O-methyltransferase CheR n=1 Tax=Vreelandella andesensis TaxID=447567 RepID=A0A3S0YJR5_9GAMM|nr:protein-glutamate O-methyltransferase CheR [Halomonas andesensis]RUR31915.1 protein-glutamate O-methyltransferase CheR [Halomonas andesensis]